MTTAQQGLYLAPPHGEMIATGLKSAIAKARPMGLEGNWVLLSGGQAYGCMTIGDVEEVPLEEFKDRQVEHGVSEKERRRWWPERSPLYLYPVERFQPYRGGPVEVSLPPGVQTRVDVKGMGLPGEQRVKAKGRWRTLKDGRHVMVTTASLVSRKIRWAMTATAGDILKKGLADGKEHGAIIDNQGNLLETKDGGSDYIRWGSGGAESAAHVMIHNHPSGASFSDADVGYVLARPEIEHMVAIGHDGNMYRFSRTDRTPTPTQLAKTGSEHFTASIPKDASRSEVLRTYANLGAQYVWRQEKERLFGEYQTKVMSKEMTGEDAWREHSHRAMIQTARKLGLVYEKVYVGG